jgi:uncharacterized damage-inducible protein DinB
VNVQDPLLATLYQGWADYLAALATAVAPLTPAQLELRGAPELRSIRLLLAHMVGARARWFHLVMGEGGDELARYTRYDAPDGAAASAEELLDALATTWRVVVACLERWSAEDLGFTFSGEDEGEAYNLSRAWIVWHLIEHDLHHGGEVSLTLGAHGLTAPDI